MKNVWNLVYKDLKYIQTILDEQFHEYHLQTQIQHRNFDY